MVAGERRPLPRRGRGRAARSSCCCTASRSSGGRGGTSCRRSPTAGYRVAAMDLRGFGASDKPPRGYDPRTLAEDASGVIRSLGDRDAAVVGQGLGGLVAWTLVGRAPPSGTPAGGRVDAAPAAAAPRAPHPDPRRCGPAGTCSATRRRWCRSAGWSPTTPRRSATLLRQWAGPGFPDAETEARYRQAAQIPGVAHCALESYRWAVRSIPRTDGVRYARRMASPVTVPDPAGARRAGPLRAAGQRPGLRQRTSRRPTAGT